MIFRALILLIFIVVPRQAGPDLLTVHVLVIKKHLAEDTPLSATLVIFHDHEFSRDSIGQVVL